MSNNNIVHKMEDNAEQIVAFAWSKFLLITTSVTIGVPLADNALSIIEVGEYVKIFSYCVASISGSLLSIIYFFKIKDRYAERIKEELKKNCQPIENINEKEAQ